MRKKDREIKNFEEILDVIERCDTIRLGIQDTPYPYVVPVSYGYEVTGEKVSFYFHGATQGKKEELLTQNPHVCVEGDICHRFAEAGMGITCEYESFIGCGRAVRVSGEEAEKGLKLMLAHCGYSGYPFAIEALKVTAVYKIEIIALTGKRNYPV